jgi:Spy/CpxP family protein refolding chaperone
MRTFITAALVIATAAAHAADPATSAYAGQEARTIKALSAEDIEALRSGQGMGLAKAAELNGYPGPAHVLALAEQLQLTPEQLAKTRDIEASMRAKAKTVGSALIAAEAQLDNLFASKRVDDRALNASLQHIAELQSELRHAHLQAHLEQTALLSAAQTARYIELRGYGHAQNQMLHEHH